jgi:hypothetical protein
LVSDDSCIAVAIAITQPFGGTLSCAPTLMMVAALRSWLSLKPETRGISPVAGNGPSAPQP